MYSEGNQGLMIEVFNLHLNFYTDQVQKLLKLSYNKLFVRNNIAEALVLYSRNIIVEVKYISHNTGITTSLISKELIK